MGPSTRTVACQLGNLTPMLGEKAALICRTDNEFLSVKGLQPTGTGRASEGLGD